MICSQPASPTINQHPGQPAASQPTSIPIPANQQHPGQQAASRPTSIPNTEQNEQVKKCNHSLVSLP
jgi:hypothetical protein